MHLWCVSTGALAPEDLYADCWDVLSPDERARYHRYRSARHRQEYLTARWLVRTVLSGYTHVRRADLSFSAGAHGRPELAGLARLRQPALRFNLSHTTDLAVCLVGHDRDLGVDAEHVGNGRAARDLADVVLTRRERSDLETLPSDLITRRFFELWTLKEAYVKARGLGLVIPLRYIEFRFHGPGRISAELDASLADDAASWTFDLLPIGSTHVVATAVRRGPHGAATLTTTSLLGDANSSPGILSTLSPFGDRTPETA